MKRTWIGIGLLAAVLTAGLLVTSFMERYSTCADDLNRAAKLALEEDWAMAEALTARAEKTWEKKRPVAACFTVHEPMEYIDGLFAQLKVYAAARDTVSYSSTCACLASQLEALAKIHSLTLGNLL